MIETREPGRQSMYVLRATLTLIHSYYESFRSRPHKFARSTYKSREENNRGIKCRRVSEIALGSDRSGADLNGDAIVFVGRNDDFAGKRKLICFNIVFP